MSGNAWESADLSIAYAKDADGCQRGCEERYLWTAPPRPPVEGGVRTRPPTSPPIPCSVRIPLTAGGTESDVEHNLIRILAIGAASAFGIGVAAGPVHADPEPNFIVGTPGNDVLVGTNHRDFIVGRRGEDRLVGRMQDDVLLGGPADDVLRAATPLGLSGRDVLRGERPRPLHRGSG